MKLINISVYDVRCFAEEMGSAGGRRNWIWQQTTPMDTATPRRVPKAQAFEPASKPYERALARGLGP